MSDPLYVHLFERLAGRIEFTRANRRVGNFFTYDDDYLNDPRATPLSPSMPLRAEPHEPKSVDAFLEGLLPEHDATRKRWAQQAGTDTAAINLLEHMGLDCAGAVQFSTKNDSAEIQRSSTYASLTDQDIAERVRLLNSDETTWSMPNEHWSLAGAQSKFALALRGEGWHEAHGAAATTHIFKPGIRHLHHQALSEHITMRAAQILGLPTARTSIHRFNEESVLVVDRYDRLNTKTEVKRLHQVDTCQALNQLPRRKYEDDGGPSAKQIADLLRRVSSDRETDVRRFSDAVIFNYIAGCPDGHAKNYSLLLNRDLVRLAPLYDLATALAYDAEDPGLREVAMAVGGRRRLGEVTARGWERHAQEMGLEINERRDRLGSLLEGLVPAFETALAEVAHHTGAADLRARLLPRLTQHAAETANAAGIRLVGADL